MDRRRAAGRAARPISGPEEAGAPRPGGIAVRGLCKRHGSTEAVAGIDFHVSPGEILGLLGPNGAGKTSTIEAVTGLSPADAGEILIGGVDARAHALEARRRFGVVLQSTGLPDAMTPREAIGLFAALHGAEPDRDALLARFGLAEKGMAAFGTLSAGQRQRLALALAFIGDPSAIFLDEPTAGLDPVMRRDLHGAIASLRAAGCAVLLATHDMDEAERLCDRVAILDRGRIVEQGNPAALIARLRTATRIVIRTDRSPAEGWPATIPGVGQLERAEGGIGFVADDPHQALAALLAWLDAAGLRLTGLRAGETSLEEVILRLAGWQDRSA